MKSAHLSYKKFINEICTLTIWNSSMKSDVHSETYFFFFFFWLCYFDQKRNLSITYQGIWKYSGTRWIITYLTQRSTVSLRSVEMLFDSCSLLALHTAPCSFRPVNTWSQSQTLNTSYFLLHYEITSLATSFCKCPAFRKTCHN